jgi:hypothetical protein
VKFCMETVNCSASYKVGSKTCFIVLTVTNKERERNIDITACMITKEAPVRYARFS